MHHSRICRLPQLSDDGSDEADKNIYGGSNVGLGSWGKLHGAWRESLVAERRPLQGRGLVGN
jgi:hypothetical protein